MSRADAGADPIWRAAAGIVEAEPAPVRAAVAHMDGPRALDTALLLAVNRMPHSNSSDHYITLLSDLGRGLGWAVVCAGLAWRPGPRRAVAARTLTAMLAANAVAQGPLKRHFRRRRPFHKWEDHIVVGPRTPDTAFPSGHTASSFAAATSLAVAYPAYAPPLLGLASAVGFSRVYLGHHYPSDVLGGMAVGLTAAFAADLLFRRR